MIVASSSSRAVKPDVERGKPCPRSQTVESKGFKFGLSIGLATRIGKAAPASKCPFAVRPTCCTSNRVCPAPSADLTDGTPHSLHVELSFEGGHTAYCEIGQVGGAFGGLSLRLDELLAGT